MAKGTYPVSEGGPANNKDVSFKSCLCALLVFVAICVILILSLAAIRWSRKPINEDDKDDVELLGLKGEREKTNQTSDKIVSNTPATFSTTTRTTTTAAAPTPPTRPFLRTTTTSDDPSIKLHITTPTTSTTSKTTTTTTTTTTPTPPTRWFLRTTTPSSDEYTTKEPSTKLHFTTSTTTTTTMRTTTPTKTNRWFLRITTPSSDEYTTKDTSTKLYITTPPPPQPPTTTTTTTPTRQSLRTTTSSGEYTTETPSTKLHIATLPPPPTTTTTTTTTTTSKTTTKTTTPTPLFFRTTTYPSDEYTTEEHLTKLPITAPTTATTTTTTTTSTPSTRQFLRTTTSSDDEESYSTTDANRHKSFITTTKTSTLKTSSTSDYKNIGPKVSDEYTFEEYSTDITTPPVTAFSTTTRRTTTTAVPTSPTRTRRTTTSSSGTEESYIITDVSRHESEITTTTAFTPKTSSSANYRPSALEYSGDDQTEEPSTEMPETSHTELSFLQNITDKPLTTRFVSTTTLTNLFVDQGRDESWRTSEKDEIIEPVCNTVGCKSVASRMLNLMNHSATPCEDFYEFACGGMQVDNADSDTWSRLSEQLYLIDTTAPDYLIKFKSFYDSCVSHEREFDYEKRIASVLKLVKEVGQIVEDGVPDDTIDLTDLFAKLILRRSLPIMDIDVDIDNQTSNFILKLTVPTTTSILKESGRWSAFTDAQKRCLDEQRHELQQLNLDLTEIYESYLACQKNHTIYLNSIQTVVRALGFYSHLKHQSNQTQRIKNLRFTIDLDILDYLNELPTPSLVRQTILFKEYTIYNISTLQVDYPFLEWNKLFVKLTNKTVENDTLIQVYFPSYFSTLFEGLGRIPKWQINNALVAMYANDLYENLVIPQAKQHREKYCLKLSSKVFPDISSNLYMRTWSKNDVEEAQKSLTNVFSLLKTNMLSALEKSEWLDEASKMSTVKKLGKLGLRLNKLEEDLYNKDFYMNSKYKSIHLKSLDFPYNAVKMLVEYRIRRYQLQGQSFSVNYLWSYFVNAYDSVPTSFYSRSLIMAPLGMVKQPAKGLPRYITMAQIGFILAKEIGRHFDSIGIQNEVILSPASSRMYNRDLKGVMENEVLFTVTNKHIGHQTASFAVSPELSVNERIADNTGLRLISDIFPKLGDNSLLPWISTSLSRDKIFFIAVAQDYCQKTDMAEYMGQLFESEILPASQRVENIIKNSDAFVEAFECPEGSAMTDNPFKRQFPHLPFSNDDVAYDSSEYES